MTHFVLKFEVYVTCTCSYASFGVDIVRADLEDTTRAGLEDTIRAGLEDTIRAGLEDTTRACSVEACCDYNMS